MNKLIVRTATEADFFQRGKKLARLADQGKHLPAEKTVSFEDPVEVLSLLTRGRLALFRAVKDEPASITALAMRLHRDRSAVKRDVSALENAGLVSVEICKHPGHGRMKEVRALADQFVLEARVA
jgi:predicted transcriptional regulator